MKPQFRFVLGTTLTLALLIAACAPMATPAAAPIQAPPPVQPQPFQRSHPGFGRIPKRKHQ